jgi:hypothetical protein
VTLSSKSLMRLCSDDNVPTKPYHCHWRQIVSRISYQNFDTTTQDTVLLAKLHCYLQLR